MQDVFELLPFDNPDGGLWKQGFPITYDASTYINKPLKVFVVPHSHNDPGNAMVLPTLFNSFRHCLQISGHDIVYYIIAICRTDNLIEPFLYFLFCPVYIFIKTLNCEKHYKIYILDKHFCEHT